MAAASFHFSFDNTLGAALIGFSVSCVVYGVLTTQVFTYFQRYYSDKPAYKLLVTFLWALDTVDQFFIGHAVYYYTITNYGSPLVLITGSIIWSLILQLTIGAVVGTIVKTCFAMRVWRFSNHNIPITGTILILTFGQLGLATAYTVKAFRLKSLVDLPSLKLLATFSLGAGVLTDTVTAMALCFFLRKLRTGYKKSDTLVNSLSIYAVNTGALTSAISLCTLILYDLHPTNFQFMGVYFVLSKLYAISFMATLNTRKIIRGKGTDREGTSNTGNAFTMVTHPSYRNTQGQPSTPTKSQLEIGVHQEVSVISEVGAESYDDSKTEPYYAAGWR